MAVRVHFQFWFSAKQREMATLCAYSENVKCWREINIYLKLNAGFKYSAEDSSDTDRNTE